MNASERLSPSISPEEWARRFHRGDLAAFEQLVAPVMDTVYTICLRMLGSRTDAEDVVQDVLVRAMEQHSSFDPSRAFRPWILTITTNACRDRLRTVWWRRVLPLRHLEDEPGGETPFLMTAAAQQDQAVRRALASLPATYREALSLYHLEDMTYVEMAEVTGMGIPALKQRVARGRVLLAEAVERMYPNLSPKRILERSTLEREVENAADPDRAAGAGDRVSR